MQPDSRDFEDDPLKAASTYIDDGDGVKEVFEFGTKKEDEAVIGANYFDEEDLQEDQDVVLGITEGGKKIVAKKHPVFGGVTVVFPDGGKLPKELQGRWTNEDKARTAVNVYLSRKNKK